MCAAAAAAILLVVMLLSAALLAGKNTAVIRGERRHTSLPGKIAGVEEREDGEEQETDIPVPLLDETRLLQMNPDYAGWIYIPGTPVSYPVVYPENNNEYLDRTFDGQKNPCGCPFFRGFLSSVVFKEYSDLRT